MVIHFSKDLLFCSRVGTIADDLGVAVQTVLSRSQLETALAEHDVRGILVDLETPDFNTADVSTWKAERPELRVIAYGPHVHTDRLVAAQDAGCDAVLSRGQFDQSARGILEQLTQ